MRVVHISEKLEAPIEKAKKKVPLWMNPVAKANFYLDFMELHVRQYERLKKDL